MTVDNSFDTNPKSADRYQIIAKINSGGNSTIYEARDTSYYPSEKVVCIKRGLPEVFNSLSDTKRQEEIAFWYTEAQLQKHLFEKYPDHIQAIIDFEVVGNPPVPQIILEMNRGESLKEKLKNEPTGLPLSQVIDFLQQIAPVVDDMNAQGLFHGDFKPGNILVEEGKYVMCDFGKGTGVKTKSDPDNIIGSPRYMTLEEIMGEEDVTHRDVHGLIVTTYELLTGHSYLRVANVNDPYSIVEAIANDFTYPIDHWPEFVKKCQDQGVLPIRVRQVFNRQFSKNPSERYATASQFADALFSVMTSPKTN